MNKVSEHSSKRRIPIAIVGLENAGKTSFTIRLKTGKFRSSVIPTRGIDIETWEDEDGAGYFNLFDLGGHTHFREMFWKTYVQLSNGIIFIIDSSDKGRLKESAKWFWNCIDWNKTAPLLILANKIDLVPHADIPEIMDIFQLSNLSQNPNRPYQIFETSIKTGINLDDAIEWFFQKINKEISAKRIKLKGMYIYLPTGLLIASHQFKRLDDELDADLVPGFLVAVDNIASGVMGTRDSLQSINSANNSILMVKRYGLLCAIVSEKGSDPKITRIIAESFLNYLQGQFTTEIKQFKVDGKIHLPKDFILNYLMKEFAENIIFE